MSYVSWLRGLAEKGGKGVVNNIDARCLGRIADELESKDAEITRLREINDVLEAGARLHFKVRKHMQQEIDQLKENIIHEQDT